MQASTRLLILVVTIVGASSPAAGQEQEPSWMRGLDDLMSVEVSSVSRKEQRLVDTSAAAYVMTRDEIRRSGMTTVPDLLRLVPGVHVARIDGNKWAVTARGFNGRWANKLLVMIDGRSIYTPYFAGVHWDAIDVPVEAIDRIEVIRGPGASIWGANAVNGVVNIITSAPAIRRETTVSAGAGSLNLGSGLVSHEGRLGDSVGYRVFADLTHRGELATADGSGAGDEAEQRLAGVWFRATPNARDTLEASLRGSGSVSHWVGSKVTQVAPLTLLIGDERAETDNWSGTFRWTRQLPQQGQLQLESFVDEWWRQDELDHHHRTVNVALQHRLGIRGRQDLSWGAEYRRTEETTFGGLTLRLTPPLFTHDLASGYVQDEIAFAGSRGHVVLGTKVERREFSGWELQPTARLHWRLTPTQGAWGAVSRALRAPDRINLGMQLNVAAIPIPGRLPAVLGLLGNPALEGEWLTAYEAGYRTAVGPATLDLAAYYNRYSGLQGLVADTPSVQMSPDGRPYLLMPLVFRNALNGSSAGGEALLAYAPRPWWKLTAGYTLFSFRPDFYAGVPSSAFEGAAAPRHQVQLRPSLSLHRDVDVDATALAVGSIGELQIPAYLRLDARIAWRPRTRLELSLVIQNLTDRRQPEFAGESAAVRQFTELPRSAHGGITWRF